MPTGCLLCYNHWLFVISNNKKLFLTSLYVKHCMFFRLVFVICFWSAHEHGRHRSIRSVSQGIDIFDRSIQSIMISYQYCQSERQEVLLFYRTTGLLVVLNSKKSCCSIEQQDFLLFRTTRSLVVLTPANGAERLNGGVWGGRQPPQLM